MGGNLSHSPGAVHGAECAQGADLSNAKGGRLVEWLEGSRRGSELLGGVTNPLVSPAVGEQLACCPPAVTLLTYSVRRSQAFPREWG